MLHVAGGVYLENCMHPSWREVYGSAGRAVSAILQIGGKATLHSYLSPSNAEILKNRAALEGFEIVATDVLEGASFNYYHALSTPTIRAPSNQHPPLNLKQEKVIRFGMIEGSAIVESDYTVYDPQSVTSPELFHANGSKTNHLAIVLNRYEASLMTGLREANPQELAHRISEMSDAEVIVIKMGAKGALVYENNSFVQIPAFKTDLVWKIGSGDNFVAHFGYFWMENHLSGAEAALLASKATAYYCSCKGFVTPKRLADFSPPEIRLSARYLDGYQPIVYLAGPFFTLSQLWLIEQARDNLREIGLKVFSPYHDVGRGSAEDVVELDLQGIRNCDVVLAIGDGLDSGTIYEIGYARAIGKPVVLYSENESSENKKMMLGSGCIICEDYVTSIYKTLWAAAEQ